MRVELQYKIKANPNLYRYLRENSYWYKELNRNPLALKQLEQEMKDRYKMTTADKINNISQGIEMIRTFMEVIH